MNEKTYRVERTTTDFLSVYNPWGSYIGSALTLRGAKRIIKDHKKGKGPGTVVYREPA